MARKFSVIEADGRRGPQVRKSVAFLLIRRLVAVREPGEPFTIRKVPVHLQPRDIPRPPRQRGTWRGNSYEHHLEPRINRFTITDSEWLRYLHGWNLQ